MVLKRLVMLLTPLVIGVVLAQEPTTGGTLGVAIYSEPPGLNFQTFTGIPAYQLSRSIYDTLARWNPATGEYEPALATAWVQESPTSWVFTLRQGVQFHRGYGEMTAEDVAFSYNNIIENSLGQSWAMAFIDHVEVVDTYTVRFVLTSPFATFFANAIGGPLGVLSVDAYEELGPEAFARPSAPVPSRSPTGCRVTASCSSAMTRIGARASHTSMPSSSGSSPTRSSG